MRPTMISIIHWIKSTAGITISVTLVVAILASIDKGPYLIANTIIMGAMLALVSMGLALVFGVMNIPQFAHGEYFMIGTLAAYYIFTPIHNYLGQHPSAVLEFLAPFAGILGGLMVGCIAGALTEIFVFRVLRNRSRANWVMNSFLVTVGLSVILMNADQVIFGSNTKGISRYWSGKSLQIFDVFLSRDRVMSLIISAVVVTTFWAFMKYTRIGRAIRSVSQDEAGALIVGINLNAIQILTLSLSCGLAAIAGATLLFIYPSYPTVGLEPLYMAWFVVIFAGLGNVMGAAVCSFIMALIKVTTIEYLGTGWHFIVPAAIIIFILIFKPSGIFGAEVRGVLDE